MVLKLTGEDEVRSTPLISLPKAGDEAHSQEFADAQGMKMHVTLGEKSPGADVLSTSVSSQNSIAYRKIMADQDTLDKLQTQTDVLQSVLQTDPKLVTNDLVNVVQGLSMIELESPDLSTIVEEKYAKRYTETAAANLDNDVLDEAMAEDPEGSHETLDRTERVAFKANYINKIGDTLSQRFQDSSWFDAAWDFTERVVPFVEWYQKQNAVGEAKDFTTSILPGGNLEEQYAYLWGLSDPKEFKTAVDATIAELSDRNMQVAMSWVEGLKSYGSSDAYLDSALALVDVASSATTPLKVLKGAMKAAVKTATKSPKDLAKIAAALGKNADSAVIKNIEDISSGDFLGGGIRRAKDLENSVPSISSPDKLLVGADNVPQAAYVRLKEALLGRAELAQRFLFEPNLIDRATPEELAQYRDILLDDYVKANPSTQKNVIDVRVSQEADVGNVYTAEVVLGQRDGTLFQNEAHAKLYFSRWIKGTDDYRIEQVGEGFQIVIPKTVDETKFLTDLKLGTTQKTPEGLANTFGWFRSPNYSVSRENELARSTAVTSHELASDLFSKLAEPFQRLPKKDFAELEEMMVVNRDKQKYYENFNQFTEAFYSRYKKNPSVEQVDTYFAYVQINDLDLVVRDLDWYKQKARLGLEEITLRGVEEPFEGKVIDRLPYGSKDRFSVSIEKDGVLGKPVSSRFIGETQKAQIDKLVEEGYKIVQVGNQALKVGDRYAGFVVVKDMKRSRVGVKNVDRKAGGHQVHKYPYYIKQGKMSADEDSTLYRGDTTLFNAANEKEAREVLESLEVARQKLVAKDPTAIKYIKDNIPISLKKFMGAIKSGEIDINTPFVVTKKGVRTIDTGAYSKYTQLHDLSKNEHNLSGQITGRYGGERSEAPIDIIRSEADTKFMVDTAPFLSPMDTLRMTSNNMLSVRVMNDYTISTNQNFLREFGDILVGSKEEQRASGVSLLMEPQFKAGADPQKIAYAKNVSRAYNNLMNHGTAFDRKLETLKEKTLSSIMPKFGPRGKQWVEDRMYSRNPDPASFLRSTAFNFKLGLFNIQQLFIQSNQMVNVAAIAGANGLRGGAVYPLFRAGLLSSSEAVIKRLAKSAEAVGLMKADEFAESMGLYKKSGFNQIGGDVAYLDDIAAPEVRDGMTKQGVKKFLSWGRTPFREGERLVRVAAWNAAYLERKAVLKGMKITRRDEAVILQRAKDLAGNMSRESNAHWQKGYGAVATQFMGYQARIMEQMLGKKLTRPEKIRLFTTYAAVYGVPTAMGSVAGIIPVRDIAQNTLYQMGIDPNENPAIETALDGFVSPVLEMIFGDEKNFSGRYGPQGLPTLYDLFREDKDWADVLLGASGGIALQTMTDSIPIMQGMASEFSDFEGGYYNLTADDFLAPLRNISTVDNAAKLYNVWNFGVWANKNEVDIMKMDLPQAVTAAITGLQPAAIEDSFAKLRATKDWKAHIQSTQKEIIKEYRQIMKMDDGSTRESMVRKLKARMQLEGFSLREQAQTWRYAADHEMMTDVFFENYEKLPARKGTK